jgi:D-3-phosphoglycerate dehydrogenase / 2-oxoglutarate reductase
MKILLLENIHPKTVDVLKSEGFQVDLLKTALSEDELCQKLKGYQVLGIRSKTQITEKVLAMSPDLLTIGAFCIGTNQIDLTSAFRSGVPVFNAPYSNTRSVAELVLCEIIGLSRKVFYLNMQTQKGVWLKTASDSYEVRGKTLGIVGYGHIGSQVSVLAEALGMQVYYYDIIKKLPLGNSKSVSSLNDLLKMSDFVTLHVPETDQTKNLIGEKELSIMKKGSYLINASRGTVVDLEALAILVKSKHIAGVAIDVFPQEPKNNNESFYTPLQGLENVVLTPHIGGSTEEAQEAIGVEVADSFARFLKRGSTLGAVNFPQVDMAMSNTSHRIVNVHKNVPGVLSEINKIVSSMGINISAQSLATNSEIGYLIMDVDQATSKNFCDEIAKLPTSIKTRVLF